MEVGRYEFCRGNEGMENKCGSQVIWAEWEGSLGGGDSRMRAELVAR